jgi:hypothetical protein
VARFSRFLELLSLESSKRASEEAIVHRLTENLLSRLTTPEMDRVLELYRENRLPVDQKYPAPLVAPP